MFYGKLCRCCENCPSFHALFPGNFKSSHPNDGYTFWQRFYHDESGKCEFNYCAYINSLDLRIIEFEHLSNPNSSEQRNPFDMVSVLPKNLPENSCRFHFSPILGKNKHRFTLFFLRGVSFANGFGGWTGYHFGGAERCSARQILSCSLHLKAARGEG